MRSFLTPIRNLVIGKNKKFSKKLPFALLRLLEIQTELHGNVSLTDSQTPYEQLRFFQKERTFRYLTDLAVRFHLEETATRSQVGFPLQITGSSSELLSEPVFFFLSELKRLGVSYVAEKGADSSPESNTSLESSSVPPTKEWLMERFACGDTWTTLATLERFPKVIEPVECARITGICLALQGLTESAEPHLEAWSIYGSPADQVWSHYSIAMLYARHHKAKKRSIEMAENHLQAAWRILCTDEENTAEHRFNQAFNRNGLALIFFRKGEIESAIQLLRFALELFPNETSHFRLHKSVLLYNLAQCQTAHDDHSSAADTFFTVLEIDPHYAENRIEYAKVLIDLEEDELALKELNKAIRLDPSIAAGWNLKGILLSQTPNDSGAVLDIFQRSYLLSPDDPQIRLDYAEALIAHQCSFDARNILGDAEEPAWKYAESDQMENRSVLIAESYLQERAIDLAHVTLREAQIRLPPSNLLVENLNYVQSLA